MYHFVIFFTSSPVGPSAVVLEERILSSIHARNDVETHSLIHSPEAKFPNCAKDIFFLSYFIQAQTKNALHSVVPSPLGFNLVWILFYF